MKVVQNIEGVLASALADLGIEEFEVGLEYPAELKNGDYSSSVALKYNKQVKMTPRSLAEKVVANLGTIEGVAKIEVAGAGFINFYLTTAALSESVERARQDKDWGKGEGQKGKKVMVEYTDPNPFKEFHIGHLMSNAIGESVARLIEFTGAEVKRANYQGDVGPHVAKAIFGYAHLEPSVKERKPNLHLGERKEDVELNNWGIAYKIGSARYEEPDGEAKKEIDEINKKIYEKSDPNINSLYKQGRKLTLEHFEKLYKVLGTKFDFYFFESETAPEGIKIVRAYPEVFKKSDGAIVYKGEKIGLHTRVFVTSKGLPTYEAKELGLAQMKTKKWPFDQSITVTAHEQSGYFEVVLAAMREVFPELASKIKHISHGLMRLPSGKMSSRTGDVVTGESLLWDLTEAAKVRAKESRAENADELAQQIAMGAIKYQVLKQASGRDIIFDRERALSLEGDSGPYLQYTHARACGVLEKAKEQNVVGKIDANAEPNNLARLLHRFPEIVEYAARELEPHLLTNYLLEFAATFNRWYANEQILDGSASSPHKVALTDAVRSTLKNGLWLLGIFAPEKM